MPPFYLQHSRRFQFPPSAKRISRFIFMSPFANAARAFKEMAKLSRGAYFKLNEQSAHMLRELLSAVAVYAAGGKPALVAHAKSKGGSSDLLLQQLK